MRASVSTCPYVPGCIHWRAGYCCELDRFEPLREDEESVYDGDDPAPVAEPEAA